MASHVNTSQIFFLNLMRIRFLLDPNAAKVKLDLNALSLNAMNSVWHQTEVIGNVAERRNQLLCL